MCGPGVAIGNHPINGRARVLGKGGKVNRLDTLGISVVGQGGLQHDGRPFIEAISFMSQKGE